MITSVNLDALRRLVRNNENAPGFYFDSYVRSCGTYGCLVGNDMIAVDGTRLRAAMACGFLDAHATVCKWGHHEYGAPRLLYRWLFSNTNDQGDTKEQRINRVLKTIAYIERKRAILYTPDGRVNELARRLEGNWMVCPKVLETLATGA